MTRFASFTVLVVVVSAIAGCESPPKQGGLNSALEDYYAQRYSLARDKAAAVQDKSSASGEREEAAYVAGLAAYQLGQVDEAERRLTVASQSWSTSTSARAKAMLGQVRLDQRRPREAAILFSDASPHLSGDDAKQCAFNAAIAYQQSGDAAASKRWLNQSGMSSTARVATSTGSTANKPSPQMASSAAVPTTMARGGFTLQVGAFREKNRAQQAATEAQKLASRDGLGAVRIITRKDERGLPLYLVQFGAFTTRETAAAARSKLGRLDYIVAPAAT